MPCSDAIQRTALGRHAGARADSERLTDQQRNRERGRAVLLLISTAYCRYRNAKDRRPARIRHTQRQMFWGDGQASRLATNEGTPSLGPHGDSYASVTQASPALQWSDGGGRKIGPLMTQSYCRVYPLMA
jgi:hypothetical protein